MLFRLTATASGTTDSKMTMTHSGVLEFTAEEGTCYIPFWMMQNLLIEEGAVITVTNASLPKATFVKLQPQHVDFLEISNPRAVLEHALRNFSCVTKGDVIQIPYNNRNYHVAIKEVQPQDAACIIETDCNVDFDAPVGYQEPEKVFPSSSSSSLLPNGDRSSACPSPTTLSTTSSATNTAMEEDTNNIKPQGVHIVNGIVIRPDENEAQPTTSFLAERTGSTGVQRNAAIPEAAPEVDYWAVAAGEGARLDGKKPAVLKDKDGNEVDIRKVRAEAAARRAEAAAAAQSNNSLSTSAGGKTLNGQTVAPAQGSDSATAATAAPISKRKKIGTKFSRLKQAGAAFNGSANSMN
jgi:ubiquitin fusion degradation protein 1